MVWVQKIVLSIILLIGVLSCHGQKASDRDPLSDSYQKIDSGDYDTAIAQLEELQSKDQGPQIKMALASAYAARAGVKIEKLWSFVKALESPRISEDSIKKNPNYLQIQDVIVKNKLLLGSRGQDDLDQGAQAMAAFEDYRVRIEALPYVSVEKRKDLAKASAVLDGATTKGSRLYRAILNLVDLRSSLADGFEYWNGVSSELNKLSSTDSKNTRNKKILCNVKITEFQGWLQFQLKQLQEITQDIGSAFPSKYQDLKDFDESMQKYQKDLPSAAHALGTDCSR